MRGARRTLARQERPRIPVPSPRLRGEGQGEGRCHSARSARWGRWGRLAALALLLGTPPAFASPPTLTFDAGSLTASGLTASGEAAFLGVMRLPRVYYQEVYTVRETGTADAEGSLLLPVEPGVGRRSVWAVVDLATGELAVAAPEDYRLNELPLPAEAIGRDADDKPSRVTLSQKTAEVLLARHGSGAWGLAVTDGGPEDADGEVDGSITLSVAALAPMEELAAPEELLAGDVLVVLDPNELTYRAATVTAALLGEEGR